MTSEQAGEPITVLMTGAGGAAVPGLIEMLRKQGFRVLAADMDPHAIGLFHADVGLIIPPGNSAEFLPTIQHLCKTEDVKAFVPLVDEELVAATELEDSGVVVLLPRREFVTTCLDKFILMQRLATAGIPIPETRLASDGIGGMSFPLVMKPRSGRGSRGVVTAANEAELDSALRDSLYAPDKLILQEYVGGTEFTVSVVVWRDGKVKAVVPKEIIFKQGITRLAVTRRNPRIDERCREIQERLRADGPFNVQLRLDETSGEPLVFEINPRFSTTMSLTIASGVDELGGLLKQLVGRDPSYSFGEWREGVVLMRRTLDEFEDEAIFRKRVVVKACSS